MMDHFRPFLKQKLKFNQKLGLFLILAFGIPRFIIVLNASKTGDYRLTSIIFVAMWLLPFLLLNKSGRVEIGIKKPKRPVGLLWGTLAGTAFCALVWWLGDMFYGNTLNNWLVYISNSYQVPKSENFEEVRFVYFLIFGITSMIFSPIGEELLYRGFIHRCFSEKLAENKASLVDSAAFALTHLAHFGILYVDNHWEFNLIPALIWVILMFFASRIFFWSKQMTNSILGAILSHAVFNLTMTYFIFFHIL
ncbi:CPBP family intramembrane glutamic endopeptidase [Allomuricauda sp. SCSIO 65647]|uniref:CPBP family intramembrane glutamic endopeptidase n=1 Tax=Allomuricauda sp. SCSIO 65647 TaxID=2908843 RepID=UPI001F460C66|nr:type II CAAX endopeptidase family protein [Muricauda sp. SCSIO 65647]UJH66536.1 CPBP family intramembrane metalloprotease [Muricauda sp. SCSIO 65647]